MVIFIQPPTELINMILYEQNKQDLLLLEKITKSTIRQYDANIEKYTEFHKLSWTELIQEAEEDEEKINKLQKRRIKNRLQRYVYYLLETEHTPSTVRQYVAKIKKLYHLNDIETPQLKLPRIIQKEDFSDLPTREEIIRVINNSSPKMKALVTLIASSGLSTVEIVNLTVNDFVEATEQYHTGVQSVTELIGVLEKQRRVIPVWNVQRQKTGIRYVTFSSPESVQYILEMLRIIVLRKELKLTDKLFGYSVTPPLTHLFSRYNDKLGLGWLETRRRFRPHALRSFFATTISMRGMSFIATEFLLGHSMDSTRSAYYRAEPEQLKREYLRVLPYLSFMEDVRTVSITDEEKEELIELKRYKKHTEERMLKLEEAIRALTQ